MNEYELGVILHPDLEEADVTPAVETISGYVESNGGKVTSVNVWGRRSLAYPIGKQTQGTYVFLNTQIAPSALKEIDRNLKLDEKVLRFLMVHLEGKA